VKIIHIIVQFQIITIIRIKVEDFSKVSIIKIKIINSEIIMNSMIILKEETMIIKGIEEKIHIIKWRKIIEIIIIIIPKIIIMTIVKETDPIQKIQIPLIKHLNIMTTDQDPEANPKINILLKNIIEIIIIDIEKEETLHLHLLYHLIVAEMDIKRKIIFMTKLTIEIKANLILKENEKIYFFFSKITIEKKKI
jgi:hypothetical protein